MRLGRPACTDIVPGTVLRHFLYKSRGNVQFFMPSFSAGFADPVERRQLMSLYAQLHAHLHNKPTPLKIHYAVSAGWVALAWSTPLFELYAVARGDVGRRALKMASERVVAWMKREEERCFIIGGAVF